MGWATVGSWAEAHVCGWSLGQVSIVTDYGKAGVRGGCVAGSLLLFYNRRERDGAGHVLTTAPLSDVPSGAACPVGETAAGLVELTAAWAGGG
jgi:hypothetical protein